MTEFRNASGKKFNSLESEQYRVYVFKDKEIRIDNPLQINVSPTGHRIFDAQGISHYIPKGWIHLYWEVHENEPHFDF